MNPNDSIEVTAPTIEKAINQALEQLGAEQDDVKIEVLSTPRAGVLGLGARQARVRVTRRAPEGASSGVTSPPPAPPVPPGSDARSVEPVANESASEPTPIPERSSTDEQLENKSGPTEVDQESGLGEVASAAEKPPAQTTADRDLLAREATDLMSRILVLMGEKATIEVVQGSSAGGLELNIKGDGSGLLIGRHGQTLDALEYVVNRILARKLKDAALPISIDTESYRARRRRQLHRMALAKGEQAKREHLTVALEPMPPRDRRIIHLALKDDPLVTTRSSGEGFLRSVEIMPVDDRREGSGTRGREQRRGRGAEATRERDRQPGQQGGFKRGQKRIV
jgi:spoIIIJ-associated protein